LYAGDYPFVSPGLMNYDVNVTGMLPGLSEPELKTAGKYIILQISSIAG
jgi:hypothetical protein